MISENTDILTRRIGPLWEESQYRDTKDPCPVYDCGQKVWHIYGSGGSVGGSNREEWDILHATSPRIEGPWHEEESVVLRGLSGRHIAAPGVVYERGVYHMLVQTEFLAPGGSLKYLTSKDGKTFDLEGTALDSIPDSNEAALYDPHPAIIRGQKYMTYSGSGFIGLNICNQMPQGWEPSVGKPDIYLAKSQSNTWAGPWQRMGKILDHKDVVHHNQHDHMYYEWGLEGSQLIELPNGTIALNTVCFLPNGKYGTRQRVFFAFAESVRGPYYSAGTILPPVPGTWESGENGHAAAFMRGMEMVLFYQARQPDLEPWRYGIATINVKTLQSIGRATLDYHRALRHSAELGKPGHFAHAAAEIARNPRIANAMDYLRNLRLSARASLHKTLSYEPAEFEPIDNMF